MFLDITIGGILLLLIGQGFDKYRDATLDKHGFLQPNKNMDIVKIIIALIGWTVVIFGLCEISIHTFINK
jgi:hypothetical protein